MKYEYIFPDIASFLAKEGYFYELLNPESHDGVVASEWLEKNFPICPSGRIDWQNVVDCHRHPWQSDEELIALFQNVIKNEKLTGEVVVLWTNVLTFGLKLDISTLCKNAAEVFSEDWDTWIFSLSELYCIENYHEGELCFGYSPLISTPVASE